jgi:hypothetical protein
LIKQIGISKKSILIKKEVAFLNLNPPQMIKKLLILIRLFLLKQNQNTPEIITAKLFGNTARWICFVFFVFQMGYGQSNCNVVKGGEFNSSADAANWSLPASSTTGWFRYGDEAYIDRDGASNISLKQNVTGLLGSSLKLSFKIKGQNADRMNCNTSGTLDVKIGGITYMRITNPTFNDVISPSDITTSNGATYTQTDFPITVGGDGTGIGGIKPGIAESALTQGTITITIPSWSGGITADLEFVASSSNTALGTLECVATRGGDDWFLDDIKLTATDPTSYNVTGTNVCFGSTATIGLSGSQVGVSYQLQRDGVNTGTLVAGTGSAITSAAFGGGQTLAGVYTVVSIVGGQNCKLMNGSVSINALPSAGADQTGALTCGVTTATLAATAPTVGTGTWSIISGTGGTITTPSSPTSTFTGTAGTTYTLRWTVSNSPCVTSSDDVIIKFNQSPTASITGSSYICATSSTTLSPTSGGTWTSSNTSIATVTNAGIVTGVAIGSATLTFASSTAPNCTSSVVISVSSGLSIVYNATGSFTVPAGVNSLQVECWGGGGSGGGSTSSAVRGGGGGAGGAYIIGTIPVSTGSYTVTVGGVKSGTTGAGAQGNPSWFGSTSTIYAEGGAGGSAPNNTTVAGGIGSSASTTTNGTLITKTAGSNGSNGTTTIGGAGGNGANTSSPEGLGGAQRNTENDGSAGTDPGGGGGGAYIPDATDHTGGSGGAGRVIITIASPTATAGGSQTICQTGTATVSGANAANGTIAWTHNGGGSLSNTTTLTPTYTPVVGDAGNTVTLTMTVSNGPCVTPATATYTVIVRPIVTATISGTTTVCQGATAPNVTFTNPLSAAITVTYNINGGTSATVSVGANTTATVAAPTGTSGTFVYNLVSAVYQSGTACSANITGSATVTVRPTVTATISGTTTVCQGATAPNVTFTNPLSDAITVTYNINGGTSATVSVGANTTATVAAPTGTSGTFVYNLVSAVYQSGTACSANITGSATVTVRPTVTATISGTTTVCQGATAPNVTFTNPLSDAITVTYNINGGTSATVSVGANTTATVAAPTGTSGTFVYNLVSAVYQSGTACSANITGSATVTVRPTVTATISGTTTVCQGATAPNVTFTNPLSAAITVTYNINGGTSATVSVGANTTATVAAPTGTSGTFVYNLVSAVYQSGTACSANITGSATVTVRPTVTATISGTTMVCQGATAPNVTFTNPLSDAITVTYNINGGTSATVSVGANTTATVAAPTGTSGTFVYNLVSAVYQSGTACSANITGSATVTVRPTVTATISGTTSVCQGATAPNVTFTNPLSDAITVTYNINGGTSATVNVGANTTATVAAPTGTSGTFVYNLVSAVYQSGTACSANITGSATVTVRPTVTATISGTTSVCQGATAPNVTFTNPLSAAITVTYNINGGTSATVSVGANTTATVAAPTGTSGTFVYNLVSAVYQSGTACSANITGSATVTVRPTVTATISGTTTVCQGATAPNVTFTNPLSAAITVTYNINGGTSATVSVGANTTATVAAPTGTSGTFVYNLVSAVYQSGTACSANITGSATVTVRPTVTATISGTTTVCQGATAPNVTFTNPLSDAITVTYNINGGTSATVNVGANTTATVAAPTGTSGTFVYNLVSAVYQSGTACSANITGSATVTVRPTVTATISGTTSVCQGATAPNVTFTNPLSAAITVTYNINGGTSATVSVGANTTATVAAPTGTSGTFVYNLVSAVYQSGTACSANITGSATVTVRPTVTATISGTTSVCQGATAPNVTFTNPLSDAITVTYNINGGTSATVNVGANTTATVVAPTGTSGTFVYNLVSAVYQSGTACSANIAGSATVIINPLPVITLHPVLTSVCENGNTSFSVATSATSPSYQWQYSIDNGATEPWTDTSTVVGSVLSGHNSAIFSLTGTPLDYNGYYVRCVITSLGCPSISDSAQLTVNPTPSTPTVGTITNISCTVNAGSVDLTDLPAGNWTITSTPATVATSGSGTSATISGLASGSYTFTVTNTSGCPSAASTTVNIFDYTSTTWTGSGWSNGAPNATKNIIIASVTPNSPFTADLAGCALTINSGVIATVSTGVTLTITNVVTTNGQLIFENNASLVQINNVTNIGAIVYKRISFPMKNFDATYWSSPVSGQTLVDLSPNTLSDKYIAYYNSAWKTEVRTNIMKPGIGYGIRVPKPNFWPNPLATTYAQPVEFKGVPNNGNIVSSQAMTAGKYYLIGNPYPSALDARAFLFTNVNNNTVLNGTIYFWTHNTAITPSGGVYVYSSNDYASFNATGGTATTGTNGAIPLGYIAAGQSFMASAKANGIVEFNNSMRVGGSNNGQFFKPGKTSKLPELEKHRLWLNMTNSGGAFKQTLIGYIDGATNSYDVDFDGETFDGNSYIDFYSINAASKLSIQGRALPFTDTDLVPLGYRSTIAGDFTISINTADGNLATQRVYLEDKQTGTINELTAGNYTFATKAGTFNDRFVLRYKNATLGTGDFEMTDDSVLVAVQNKKISINSTVENIDKVFIYDISGKQLYKKDAINNLQLIIETLPFAQQVLLVKIILDNGYQTTKKVIFK